MFINIKIFVLIYLFGDSVALDFEDFEGYLKRLDNRDNKVKIKDREYKAIDDKNGLNVEPIGEDSDLYRKKDYTKATDGVTTPLSLKYIKESMDKDTACCMLGQIAGDKGYHCHALFYSYDILQRNQNRAHNRKLSFYGRDKMPHFGEKLMIRFEKCLAKKGFIFNKCCHLAAKEKENLLSPQYNTFQHYLYNLRQHNNNLKN